MQGPNQWPSPELLPDYRPAITAYFDAVSAVGRRLLHLLALGLGLPSTWFDDKFEKPIALLRPLHYSGRVSVPDAGCDPRIASTCSTCHAPTSHRPPSDTIDALRQGLWVRKPHRLGCAAHLHSEKHGHECAPVKSTAESVPT